MSSPAVAAPRPSKPSSPSATDAELLRKALAFVDKASGTALGIAMSGRHHPNPDGTLTDLAQEGMALSEEIRSAIRIKAGA